MRLAVLKERRAFETRVAATPESVKRLIGLGLTVAIEAGAGADAAIPDAEFAGAGAEIAPDAAAALAGAGIVFAVQVPEPAQRSLIPRGALLVCIANTDTGMPHTIGNGWIVRAAPRTGLIAVGRSNEFAGFRRWVIVRQDGTLVRQLPKSFWDVGWAPDGRHLAVFEHGKLAIIDLRGHPRFLRVAVGEEARAPTFSPNGRLIAFVNHHGFNLISFVDTGTGKPVGRWLPGVGFAHADPTWDATGTYIPTG